MAIYRGSGGAGDATGDATNASQLALAAADEAQASATSAASSATNAANSASAAAADAADAATSETNAAGSAADALASENAAASSASDAADSAAAAATSATNATSSASTASTQATNASNSASSASTSASNAANSATSASTSATSASNSASAAATSETNAGNSATAAATSATNAAASASTASTQASNASTSATNAASSATAASSSASSASSSASAASTSATNAASSSSAASTSASNAATSETNASNSASAAATSATNAANSATAAAASATEAATFDPALYLSKAGNLSGLANTVTAANNIGINPYGNGFKNRIIDGGFIINQRGYTSGTSLSSGSYGHDRWKAGSGGCTYTFTQGSLGVNTTVTITAGTLVQVIEGCNLAEGGTYVLSWTGTAQGRLNGGSYGSSGSVTVTGWTAGANLSVEFNTGTLGSVQLEKGSTATSFDYRPYGTELALCQRYYIRLNSGGVAFPAFGNGIANANNSAQGLVVRLPVAMRISPTPTVSACRLYDGAAAINITSISSAAVCTSPTSLGFDASSPNTFLTAGRPVTLQGDNNAASYIEANAEL